MESLIAFLLDNIFIVIVAAGFLMSLLGKGKQQQRRVGRMPDFGGGPMQSEPAAPNVRPFGPDSSPAPAYEQTPQPVYTSSMSQPSSEGQRMMARSNQDPSLSRGTGGAGRPSSIAQAARSQAPSRSAAPVTGSAALKRVDADDLRQAVLWAEILGPPRARKPHSRHIR